MLCTPIIEAHVRLVNFEVGYLEYELLFEPTDHRRPLTNFMDEKYIQIPLKRLVRG